MLGLRTAGGEVALLCKFARDGFDFFLAFDFDFVTVGTTYHVKYRSVRSFNASPLLGCVAMSAI
jgi:hypothetical protein